MMGDPKGKGRKNPVWTLKKVMIRKKNLLRWRSCHLGMERRKKVAVA